ncbi:MAG: hypothetical protein HRU15_04360, partial [Planctomycetes bacterium]|nr:hypothetical protein [Planctomycetota bacterium]
MAITPTVRAAFLSILFFAVLAAENFHPGEVPSADAVFHHSIDCLNGRWDCYWTAGTGGTGSSGECPTDDGTPCGPGSMDCYESSGSRIGYLSREHRHDAVDYQVEQIVGSASGCAPCGSAGDSGPGQLSPQTGRLDAFSLKRYRHSLSYYKGGSFGKAQFCEYDYRIKVFYEDTYHGTGVGAMQVHFPDSMGDARFFEEYNSTAGDLTVDGVYRERGNYYKSMVLYDVNDVVT